MSILKGNPKLIKAFNLHQEFKQFSLKTAIEIEINFINKVSFAISFPSCNDVNYNNLNKIVSSYIQKYLFHPKRFFKGYISQKHGSTKVCQDGLILRFGIFNSRSLEMQQKPFQQGVSRYKFKHSKFHHEFQQCSS